MRAPESKSEIIQSPKSKVQNCRRLLVFLAVGMAMIVATWWVLREREPIYKGRTVSEWAILYQTGLPEAREAILNLGTNTFPCILQWLRYEPSSNKSIARRYLPLIRRWINADLLIVWLSDGQNEAAVQYAYSLLDVQQEQAAPLAPALLELSYHQSTTVASRALFALTRMGPSGLPYLIRALRDPAHPHRIEAVRNLMSFHNRHLPKNAVTDAIQALTDCNGDSDVTVQQEAADLLSVWAAFNPALEEFKKSVSRTNELFRTNLNRTEMVLTDIRKVPGPRSPALIPGIPVNPSVPLDIPGTNSRIKTLGDLPAPSPPGRGLEGEGKL